MGKKDYLRYLATGKIRRDGKLVDKEEWLKTHPTKEMKAKTKADVKDAVAKEMANKFSKPYLCSKCQRKHKVGSKIYGQHKEFAQEGGG